MTPQIFNTCWCYHSGVIFSVLSSYLPPLLSEQQNKCHNHMIPSVQFMRFSYKLRLLASNSPLMHFVFAAMSVVEGTYKCNMRIAYKCNMRMLVRQSKKNVNGMQLKTDLLQVWGRLNVVVFSGSDSIENKKIYLIAPSAAFWSSFLWSCNKNGKVTLKQTA